MTARLNDGTTVDFKKNLLAGGSRLQTSEAVQLFEDRHQYNTAPVLWDDDPENDDVNETVAHLPNESGVSLSIPGNSGDKVTRQTFEHFTYTPSKPLKFEFAILFPAEAANLRARAGAFTTENGFFLEKEGTTLNVVRRTKTSGSVVDNEVAQASWNVDKLDGTGPSGKTLDLTKIQMVFIEYLWYGAGTARIGFDVDGVPIIVHEFYIANTIATPSLTTGNLPIRYEMENTGATSVTSTMKTYGASVISEGGESSTRGYLFSAEGTVTAASGARTHALSVQPDTVFNSIANRIKFELDSIEVLVTGANPVKWEICYGQAFSSGPTLADANTTYSGFRVGTGGTLSGDPAIVGPSGYVAASTQTKGQVSLRTQNILPVTLDATGAVRDLGRLTVLVTGIGGTSACQVILNWKEIY